MAPKKVSTFVRPLHLKFTLEGPWGPLVPFGAPGCLQTSKSPPKWTPNPQKDTKIV